jgi:NAD(P)-dependent dehydrogenase (short-subunit alcohol dehydrogenase family)
VGDKLDIVVANAGISGSAAIEDQTIEKFDILYAVNVRAPYFLVQLDFCENLHCAVKLPSNASPRVGTHTP